MWESIKEMFVWATALAILVFVMMFALEHRRLNSQTRARESGEVLMQAAAKGDAEAIRDAVSRGASIDYRDHGGMTPLMLAVQCRQPLAVRLLLKLRADVSASDDGALRIAVREENADLVRLLLDAGANPSACAELLRRAEGKANPAPEAEWLTGRM